MRLLYLVNVFAVWQNILKHWYIWEQSFALWCKIWRRFGHDTAYDLGGIADAPILCTVYGGGERGEVHKLAIPCQGAAAY